jgi:hypothetical protein
MNASVYSVKYRKNHFDQYSRVTLKAVSVNDALERACYAITYASPWRPEDIDLHAVYDEEENLIWIDEPYDDLAQKRGEFRGMERREFLARFGATAAAILFGLRPSRAMAGTTTTALSGTASGFPITVNYLVVGGGGGANRLYGGGGGGGFQSGTNVTLTSGTSYTVTIGGGGLGGKQSPSVAPTQGSSSSFNGVTAGGGGGGSDYPSMLGGGSGTPQSNTAGASATDNSTYYAGSGGGGAGGSSAAAGASASSGGVGSASSITGTSTYYGGGGAGGWSGSGSSNTAATGGDNFGFDGTANRGGGGGAQIMCLHTRVEVMVGQVSSFFPPINKLLLPPARPHIPPVVDDISIPLRVQDRLHFKPERKVRSAPKLSVRS